MRKSLREYRKEIRKITIMEAAKELGVTSATLSRVESGKQNIRPQLALKIERWSNGWIKFDVNDLLKLGSSLS